MLACVALWGRHLVHIFDRGFASSPWLGLCFASLQRLVLRCPHKNYLIEESSGQGRKAWAIAPGSKAWGQRDLWDSYHRRGQVASELASAVRHPDYRERPLWLVLSRLPGGQPWYLLTTEQVHPAEDDCRVVLASSRRWQSERSWRHAQSEVGEDQPSAWQACTDHADAARSLASGTESALANRSSSSCVASPSAVSMSNGFVARSICQPAKRKMAARLCTSCPQ
jgi:hypothetical protein